jgi:hypothetical protein
LTQSGHKRAHLRTAQPVERFDVDHSDEPETEFNYSSCRLKFIEFVSGESPMIRLLTVSTMVVTGALLLVAFAQEQPKQPNTEQTQSSYVPELAELMDIAQARFFRLSYSPEAGNWQLAEYELAHLRKTFDVATKFYPVFGDVQQKRLIQEATEPALNALDNAIGSEDLRGFGEALEVLRLACNNCHYQAKVGFIMVDKPRKALSGPQPRP